MATSLVNKHLRHRERDTDYNTYVSYNYANDSLLESRRKLPAPKNVPVTRTIRCVASYDKESFAKMIDTVYDGTNPSEPSEPLNLYELSITRWSQYDGRDRLTSLITKDDFDFLCDSNEFTVTIEYSVKDKRMPPLSYSIYGHTQHTITKAEYNDRSKIAYNTWMGLSPEHRGMGSSYKIDYDVDGDIDRTDGYLACLAPVSIFCSNVESDAMKARCTEIISKNPNNEVYYITNSNHLFVHGGGDGMIHSITIVATQDPFRPNYAANVALNKLGPRYFTDPWSRP